MHSACALAINAASAVTSIASFMVPTFASWHEVDNAIVVHAKPRIFRDRQHAPVPDAIDIDRRQRMRERPREHRKPERRHGKRDLHVRTTNRSKISPMIEDA